MEDRKDPRKRNKMSQARFVLRGTNRFPLVTHKLVSDKPREKKKGVFQQASKFLDPKKPRISWPLRNPGERNKKHF